MGLFSNRRVEVSVGVYYEPGLGFLLGFNPKWNGYSFPMKKFTERHANAEHAATDAFRESVRNDLFKASAKPLFTLEVLNRISQRTNRPTDYVYRVFEIDPGEPFQLKPTQFGPACRLVYLNHETFPTADFVTWTAREVYQTLLKQDVAVGVITRHHSQIEAEYLLLNNSNYRGYFPIAARVRTEAAPRLVAQEAIRHDTGYMNRVDLSEPILVTDQHYSPRFECVRDFTFHVFKVGFRGDAHQQYEELEAALIRRGNDFNWFPGSGLTLEQENRLSPTVACLVEAMRTQSGLS